MNIHGQIQNSSREVPIMDKTEKIAASGSFGKYITKDARFDEIVTDTDKFPHDEGYDATKKKDFKKRSFI